MHLQSALLSRVPGVLHGFGSLDEEVPALLSELWQKQRPAWKQVHGTAGAEVRAPGEACGEVDALWTARARQPIAVVSADCVPILLAHRSGRKVAAVHAGWRGTRARILSELFASLMAQGDSPGEWVAATGPAIGPCCYEVSEELALDFAREFAAAGEGVAVPRFRHLDLPAINAFELRQLGLAEVEILRACTCCSVGPGGPLFHSYRREGGGTRQYSMIGLGLSDPAGSQRPA